MDMVERPLVSVLMTSYNREKYIAAAIESVLASSYENFELIITDDRSKDRTVEIARGYAEKDRRVKIYVNDKNLGDYLNRNKAASYARGKYLKYIDADDYIYPWGLQLLVSMMEAFPDAGWGLCSLEQDIERPFPFILTPGEAYHYHYLGPGIFLKAPLSSIIKRNVFESAGGFSGKQHLGDFELWHLLALKEKVVLMPGGIVWHRTHDEQQSVANKTDARVPFKYLVSACHFLENSGRIPLDPARVAKITAALRKSMKRLIISKIIRGEWKMAIQLQRMMSSHEYDFKDVG